MAGVKGDFARLRGLIGNLDDVGRGLFTRRVSDELALETTKLMADGFRKEQDPYGQPWAPLKSRKGRILRDTGRMAASANAVPLASGGVRGQISTGYARVHQHGAEYTRRARLQARAGNRFVSRKKAERLKKTKRGRSQLRYSRIAGGQVVIPRRMMVPDASRGLGPIWSKAYARIARKTIRVLVRTGIGGA